MSRDAVALWGETTIILSTTPHAQVAGPFASHQYQQGGRTSLMDGRTFDAWTRRRVGLAAGGLAMTLFGWAGEPETAARRKKDKNKDKKRCRKLGQTCDQSKKNKQCCSDKQLCAQISGQGSDTFCCNQRNERCSENSDCCGNDRCSSGRCSAP
jgi:hypothetical protein